MGRSVSTRVGALAATAALLLVPHPASAATPDEEYNDCVSKYLSAGGGAFDCSVCGVGAGCTGNDCHWGSLKANAANDAALAAMLDTGFQLYCLNRGGTLVASASLVGSQGATLDRALGPAKAASQLQVGGVLEYAAYDVADAFGVAAPFSFNRSLSSKTMDLDLAGSLLFGKTDAVTQYGLTTHPSLRFFPASGGGSKQVFGASLPLQAVMISGSDIETSLIYHAGLGALAGYASDAGWGVGFAADAIYAEGVQLPFQFVGRWSTPLSFATLAIQPGLSGDAISAGDVLSTLQQNVLVGLDTGTWLLGLRIFRQGDDGWVFAAGASNSTQASRLAAGTDQAYARSPKEPATTPAPAATAPVRVAVALDVEDVTLRARLRAIARERLEAAGLSLGGGALTASNDVADLDAARRRSKADAALSIRVEATAAGSARVQLLFTARGVVAKRDEVVEPHEVESLVRTALQGLFASVSVRALREGAPAVDGTPPPPPPPRPPPPPPPPDTPPTDPPDGPAAPPNGSAPGDAGAAPGDAGTSASGSGAPEPPPGGCVKDTDCKGDRICEAGKCVAPK